MKAGLLILLTFFISELYSQTIISNSIYSNTTWDLANSPYIVTNPIVVYPGVTLIIEPGVTVKFDSLMGMEIRDATLIAEGTITDSITLTSNTTSAGPGSWASINADTSSRFKYCNVYFAKKGIMNSRHVRNSNFKYNIEGTYDCMVDSCVFKNNSTGAEFTNARNSIIKYNYMGMGGGGYANNCIIDSNYTGVNFYTGSLYNCGIRYNQYAVAIELFGTIDNCVVDSNYLGGIRVENECDSIANCLIRYNGGTGIWSRVMSGGSVIKITDNVIENNDVGVELHTWQDSLYCNRICNNNQYDLKFIGWNNYTLPGNYWCTTDSLILSTHIYDGYDDGVSGLVSFYPVDTSGCNFVLGVPDAENNSKLEIFPNPARESFYIQSSYYDKVLMQIINLNGQVIFERDITFIEGPKEINTNLPPGVYNVLIRHDSGIEIRKLLIFTN